MSQKNHNGEGKISIDATRMLVISSFTAALTEKCPDTAAHCRRVATHAVSIGVSMGLTHDEISLLKRAALLHDIGKLVVERSYINKPGKLNREEWEEMKRHPEIGAAILKPYPFFHRATRIVYTHHERYDGKGYPRGLSGSELCIFSSIIAVADTIDAMTAGRAYRTTATGDEVVEELKRERGKQFHPEVVDAFIGAEPEVVIEVKENYYHSYYKD